MLHFASQRVFAICFLTGESSLKILKEVGKQPIGEGAEEALGNLFDSLIEKATINKDGNLNEMYEESISQMPMDFISGALTGVVMNGGTMVTNVRNYGVAGARVQETITEANAVARKFVKLEKSGKLDSDTQKALQDKLLSLNEQYQEQLKAVQDRYGADSFKGQNMQVYEDYMNDISTSSAQDLTIREVIAKHNKKNNSNIGYQALNQDSYAELLKQYNPEATESDFMSNAFVDTEGNIVVNKNSEAYKSGKLYNTIGHEIIHIIEKTDGYNE